MRMTGGVIGMSAFASFSETSGFMFPHRIEYMDGAGRTLAIETIDEIEVEVIPFDLEQETIAH